MTHETLPSLRPQDSAQGVRLGMDDSRRRGRPSLSLQLEPAAGDTHPTLRAAYAFLYNELHQFQDSMEDLKRQSRREHEDLRREVRDLTLQTQDVLREIQELKQVINASTNLMVMSYDSRFYGARSIPSPYSSSPITPQAMDWLFLSTAHSTPPQSGQL
ncbi:hypothetical protein NCS52_01026900 [Fusarium sp. LHS14.1]|nr:hypothetical protein NCS52_01026900 [Fusarium sp. LHS14.1]